MAVRRTMSSPSPVPGLVGPLGGCRGSPSVDRVPWSSITSDHTFGWAPLGVGVRSTRNAVPSGCMREHVRDHGVDGRVELVSVERYPNGPGWNAELDAATLGFGENLPERHPVSEGSGHVSPRHLLTRRVTGFLDEGAHRLLETVEVS